MPKNYKRNCNFCGQYYEGQNEFFCHRKCFYNSKSGYLDTNLTISSELHQILEGVVFSDGNLRKQSSAYLRFAQSLTKMEYVVWLAQKFGVSQNIKTRTVSLKGNNYPLIEFSTRSNELFTSYYDRWYPNGKKVIPSDFKITPISLYHLYIGDGCLDLLSNSPRYRIRIATCCFDKVNIEKVFLSQLDALGIRCTFEGKNVVVISRQDSLKRFFDFVQPNDLACFDYKFRCLKDTKWLNRFKS